MLSEDRHPQTPIGYSLKRLADNKTSMKIAILTLGTRGDVQPYAVLGKALQERGHEVVLATAKNFDSFIESYGLDFVAVNADFQAMINSEERNKIKHKPWLAKKYIKEIVNPMMRDALIKFYEVSKKSDLVLFHSKTMADNFADQFPDRMIKTDVIPSVEPTSAFSNPILSWPPVPRFLNKYSYKINEWSLKMWTKPVHEFRQRVGLPKKFKKPKLPSLYGISESLLPIPDDYPKNSFFTGFWFDNASNGLDQDLLDFISHEQAPLLITFGSMPFDSKVNVPELIHGVANQLKVRIIVVRGWGLVDTKGFQHDPNIKIIDAAPYDQLFPLVKAVVHHGGIGTTAMCLKAGKPFWVCPVLYPLGDQFFWGKIAYQKGVAVYPKILKKMTQQKFLANVEELLYNQSLYTRAKVIADDLSKENGIQNAVDIIEKHAANVL